MALWADLACVGLSADVRFLLLGDFRQLPAVLDSWAGPISAPLEHSQLIRDLAGTGTSSRRTRAPTRHLQLREVAAGAGQGEAEGALPLQARVAGHHAGHQPQQAHGRQRSGEPGPGAGGLKAAPIGDTSHPHRFGLPNNQWVYCAPKQPAEHEGVAGPQESVGYLGATCPSGAIAGASALLSSFEASSVVTWSSRDWMAAALLPEAAVFTARSVT